MKTELKRDLIIFFIFGIMYVTIEVLFRGYSHISMFILGGLCGLIIGHLDEWMPKISIIKQCILGSIIITLLEFVFGYILNIKLGLNIWDYSNLKFNIMGQVSLLFTGAWIILSFPAIKIDNYLRKQIEEG